MPFIELVLCRMWWKPTIQVRKFKGNLNTSIHEQQQYTQIHNTKCNRMQWKFSFLVPINRIVWLHILYQCAHTQNSNLSHTFRRRDETTEFGLLLWFTQNSSGNVQLYWHNMHMINLIWIYCRPIFNIRGAW